jgi:hypothetical protein
MSDSHYHLSPDFEAKLREIIRDELHTSESTWPLLPPFTEPMTSEHLTELTETAQQLDASVYRALDEEQIHLIVDRCLRAEVDRVRMIGDLHAAMDEQRRLSELERTRDMRDLTQAIRELAEALRRSGAPRYLG